MTSFTAYITTLISLLFVVVFLFWFYRDYRIDKFRQSLFCLRDELFDEAAAGKLSFDDAAYNLLRNTMNGAIRHGHRISLPQMFLFFVFAVRDEGQFLSYSERFNKTLSGLNGGQRKIVEHYRQQMNMLIIEHLLFSSPLLLLTLILPIVFAFEAKRHTDKLITLFKAPLDRVDNTALLHGQ